MSKTMTKEQRKNSKYSSRDFDRKKKYSNMEGGETTRGKRDKPKQKWRPHSEIEVD